MSRHEIIDYLTDCSCDQAYRKREEEVIGYLIRWFDGHAYSKHRKDFGYCSRRQFAVIALGVIMNGDNIGWLGGRGQEYILDNEGKILVILNGKKSTMYSRIESPEEKHSYLTEDCYFRGSLDYLRKYLRL